METTMKKPPWQQNRWEKKTIAGQFPIITIALIV